MGWDVQGKYAEGWETLTTEDTKQEASDTKRLYDQEEPEFPHRIRREKEES